ncbi:MAG: AMP-binding protein [Micromonosporaceae bacterium]|nr:AMP-binding protein [Micromonosporaceae bacterium]
MTGARDQRGHDVPADTVLETVRRLVAELRAGGSEVAVSLDSALEVDLGLDSLAVAELRTRLEQACGVTLPDQALTRGGTVTDWVELVAEAEAIPAGEAQASREAAPATPPRWRPERARPEHARTATPPRRLGALGEVLDWHCDAHPRRVHLRILDHSGRRPRAQELSYQDLAQRSQRVAAALAGHGVGPGDRVGIMLPTGADYFTTFLGIGLRGGVPVPLYPPARPAQLEEHLRRQARILDNAGAVALVTVPAAKGLARLVRAQASALRSILTPAEPCSAEVPEAATRNVAAPDDLALLQYTSGSTGDPKGVMLTHAHLLANIRALGSAVRATPEDVFVSWLPLYHDMGLIGAWLATLYHGIPLAVMSPMDFLARPSRWLWAVHHHRATLSAAPNFGYELCLRIPDDEVEGLDLSSWRLTFNGAEPVSPETIRRFTERFAPHGFRPETMTPVYGLAEAALGVTCPLPGAGPRVDAISREALARHGRAEPVTPGEPETLRLVGCGRPLPGYQVRVTDPAGQVLAPRQEGRIEFTGPSATAGYHRSPEHTARLCHGDWLSTGDLGYVADGELFVTGRAKDIIIRAGRNLHPAELEDVVGEIPGVRKGCVAVFAAADPASATERLVVLAESRSSDPEAVASLRQKVASAAIDVLGTPPDDVVIAPPGAVLKTSSGKVRRAASRARYESGAVANPAAPAWWQVARFAWAGALPQARRWARAVSAVGFAAYAWALMVLLAPPVWLAVVTLPRASWRWQALRLAGRAARWLTAIPLLVEGADRPAGIGPCVIVANHGSYLDGLALMVSSPRPVTFVAGADFRPVPFVGIFLQRLGCEFVERRQPEPGAPDTRRIARAVRAGRPIVIFPEGSMSSAPGLRPFQLGAFAIAVDAGAPVVPAGVNGARSVLRPDHGFPRRGAIEVRFGEPVPPAGADWHAVVALRDAARAEVLHASGEHDTVR